MFADCIASSSRFTVQDYWEPHPSYCPFSISDCRSERILADPTTKRTSDSYSSIRNPQSLSLQAGSASSYSTQFKVPLRSQSSPGVWTDGNDTVYSSALPEVQRLLAKARATLQLPATSSELVFTLAALEVFYKPGDPVHWMFWSDDRKNATADVVTRISLHRPVLIQSAVAWNGKPEYLSILASHHGTTWRQIYERQPWFTILVPPKPTTPPRFPNLRKRKIPPGAFREPSKSPGFDEDELPSNRVGTSRAPTPEATKVDTSELPVQNKLRRNLHRKAKQATPLPPSPVRQSPVQVHQTTVSEAHTVSVSLDSELASSINTRKKRKINLPSRYPKPVLSREPSSPLLGSSSPLDADSLPPSMTELPMPSHARNRSTSTISSAKTVVASDESRGTSVASGMTAVETSEYSKKRNSDAIDDVVVEVNEHTRGRDDYILLLPLDSIIADGKEGGMVTRGRSQARTGAGGKEQVSDFDDLEGTIEKVKSTGTIWTRLGRKNLKASRA